MCTRLNGQSLMRILWAFKSSFLAILMPGIILGGILFGIVTPTEAAAIAVFYALFIAIVVYRALTVADIVDMLIRTARITGAVFLIIASASILSWWMTFMQIPQKIAAFFLFVSSNPNVIIGLIKVTTYLLDRQIRYLEKVFVDEGGLSERMTRARLKQRTRRW